MISVAELYEMLRKLQEPKGFFFNNDRLYVNELLENLIVNKNRYGYMSCPCRLASGEYEADRDIICACEYRAKDIEEYGSCYCGLYVSKGWNDGKIARLYVPERRPVEKMPY